MDILGPKQITHQGAFRVLLEKRLLFSSTSKESTFFVPKLLWKLS